MIISDCAENRFKCDNGQCLPERMRCDGSPDCPQNEDEEEFCGRCITTWLFIKKEINYAQFFSL